MTKHEKTFPKARTNSIAKQPNCCASSSNCITYGTSYNLTQRQWHGQHAEYRKNRGKTLIKTSSTSSSKTEKLRLRNNNLRSLAV